MKRTKTERRDLLNSCIKMMNSQLDRDFFLTRNSVNFFRALVKTLETKGLKLLNINEATISDTRSFFSSWDEFKDTQITLCQRPFIEVSVSYVKEHLRSCYKIINQIVENQNDLRPEYQSITIKVDQIFTSIKQDLAGLNDKKEINIKDRKEFQLKFLKFSAQLRGEYYIIFSSPGHSINEQKSAMLDSTYHIDLCANCWVPEDNIDIPKIYNPWNGDHLRAWNRIINKCDSIFNSIFEANIEMMKRHKKKQKKEPVKIEEEEEDYIEVNREVIIDEPTQEKIDYNIPTVNMEEINELQNQINQLNEDITELNNEINRLNEEIKQLNGDKAKQNAQINKLNAKINKLNSEIKKVNEEKIALIEKIKELNDKIIQLNAEINKLNSKNEKKDKKIQRLINIINDLNQRLEEAEKRANFAETQLKAYENYDETLASLQHENALLKHENSSLILKTKQLNADLKKYQAIIHLKNPSELEEKVSSENSRLNDVNDDLRVDIEQLKLKLAQDQANMEKSLKISNSKGTNGLEENYLILKSQLEQLESENTQLKKASQRKEKYKQENLILREEVENLQNNYYKQKMTSTKSQKEVDELNKTIEELKSKINQLTLQISQTKINQLNQINQSDDDSLENLRALIQKLSEEKMKKEEEIRQLKLQLATEINSKDVLNVQVRALKAAEISFTQEIETFKRQVQSLQQKVVESSSLERQLTNSKRELEKAESDNSHLRAANKELNTNLLKLNERFKNHSELESNLDSANQKIMKLKVKKKVLQEEVKLKNEQITHLQNSLKIAAESVEI